MEKRGISICLLLFFLLSVEGQENFVVKIPIDYRNDTKINPKKIFVDSKGFIWYSTIDALVHERGNSRKVYSFNSDSYKKVGFPLKIFEATDHIIWSTDVHGAKRIDPEKNEVQRIQLEDKSDDPFANQVLHITEDEEGYIWLCTAKAIYRYHKDGSIKKYRFTLPNRTLNNGYFAFFKAYKNAIVYKIKGNQTLFRLDLIGDSLKESEISSLNFPETESAFYFSKTLDHLNLPNTNSGSYQFLGKKYHYSYVKELNGYFVQMPFQLFQIDSFNSSLITYKNKDILIYKIVDGKELILHDKISLKHYINDLDVDTKGNIFAMTAEGIFCIDPSDSYAFKKDLFKEDQTNPISTRNFAKTFGENIYLLSNRAFFVKKKDQKEFEPLELFYAKSLRPVNHLEMRYGAYKQNDSIIVLYGFTGYLEEVNIKTKILTPYIPSKSIDKKGFDFVVDVTKLHDDHLILGTAFGAYLFNTKTKEFSEYNQLNDSINLKNVKIQSLYLSNDKKRLWIGTFKDGLYVKNLQTNEVKHYTEKNTRFPIISNEIKVVQEASDQSIWVGTAQGVQKINPDFSVAKTLTVNDGMNNGFVVGILEAKNSMWFSTFDGLIRYDLTDEAVENYLVEDGLTDNEFNFKSFYKENDSSFYFGGINGIINFDPNKIKRKKYSSHLYLTDIEKYDFVTEKDSVYSRIENNTIVLPYNKNYAKLKFTINDLVNFDKNTYQYRIPELRENWVNLGNRGIVEFFGIEPGNYTLEVRGYDSAGNQTNTLSYKIDVKQIFYKTTDFKLLLAFLLLVIASTILYFRNNALREKVKLKEALDELENKALLAQMNPHFIFNTLNSIQSTIVLEGEEQANKYIGLFSNLIRRTLDMVNAKTVNLFDEIRYLTSYIELQKFIDNDDFVWKIEVDKKIDQASVKIPCLLLQPIVENAIKHGLSAKKGEKKLHIDISQTKDHLKLEIIDNGIGRKASSERKKALVTPNNSWANQIMTKRIAKMNLLTKKEFELKVLDLFENGKANGTKVTLSLPLSME